jgi:hypothetical protein
LDPLVPNQVRYRAALHSEDSNHNLAQRSRSRAVPVNMCKRVRLRLSGTGIDGSLYVNAVIDHVAGAGFTGLPDRKQSTRVAACVAVSLAVHALLLSIYRQPAPPAAPVAVSEALTVRLQAKPETPPAAEPAPQPAARTEVAARPAPRRIIAVPPQQAAPENKPFAVDTPPPEDTAPRAAPRFNLDAARDVARRVANEPDPARVGTPLERLPPPPLQTESKLERGIKGAKRGDCKDGIPGGLLAPLYLMMEKKDSGCKW